MIKKKKILVAEELPDFDDTIKKMPVEDKLFVDKSMEVASFILLLMQHRGIKQRELAERMGKTEAEVSKWLAGMHNFTLRSLTKLEAALNTNVLIVPKHTAVAAPPITTRNKIREKEETCKTAEPLKMNYGKLVKMRREHFSEMLEAI